MPDVGRELHLEDEIPGRDEPPFERVEWTMKLPGTFSGRIAGRRLSPGLNFLLVCGAGVGVAVVPVFICATVGAPSWITGAVAAGTSITVVCLGLFWLSRQHD